MTAQTLANCPKCGSAKTMAVPDSQAHLCYACKHEFILERTIVPLRIFLSYGHDANEELVRSIYTDLKARGHDVWFDKTDIKAGDDWRRSITSGITECDRFFSFLSKHSTRDPGVCLDEIRIAIGAKGGNIQSILVESEDEVKLPPSISHIQWVDMRDWQERRASGEAAWEKWYQEKLAEIIRVVESDESRKFAGEITALEEYLKPLVSDFAADARIQKLLDKKLTGRAWLFEAVEKWRTAVDRSSRIFWMMGLPGFGKSFFAAHLAHFYGRGTVIGVHFCAYDKPDHRSAPRIIRTLAFQLATRLPDYRKLLLTLPEIAELDRKQTSAELFDYLLANPLKLTITGGRERHLIVIDALDEAGGDGRNELVEMLARHAPTLPDWIGLVVTSRPESDVRAPLQGLNPFVLDTATEANRADLRDYLRRELATPLQNRPDADRLVEQILEKSEGVFLYVEGFCEDIHKGYYSLERPETFPQGLGEKFFLDFRRYFPDLEKFRKEVRPALRAILAAREPLPVETLQRLFHWEEEGLHDFVRALGSLFSVVKEARTEVSLTTAVGTFYLGSLPVPDQGGGGRIKSFHRSLDDWLSDDAKAGVYFVSVKEGHRILAEAFQQAALSLRMHSKDGVSAIPLYLREHGLDHLALCGRFLADLSANEIAEIARVSAWRKYTPAVGGLMEFAPSFVSASIKHSRFDQLAFLLDGLEEAARRFYVDAELLRVEKDISGKVTYMITGKAKDASHLRGALAVTEHAIWVLDQVLERVGDCMEFRDLVGKMGGMRYMTGGLDVALWASDLSGYFEDAGGVAYGMIRNLEQGRRALTRD